MKYEITSSPSGKATDLLLYFAGWGTTPEAVGHLTLPEGCDYVACYDYTQLPPQDLPDLNKYSRVYIVGWSMGVWAAEQLAEVLPTYTKAIAVNGTPYPMSDLYGIPNKIFQKTLEGLDDENRARFNRRMCGGKSLTALYNSFSARSTEDLRDELMHVYNHIKDVQPSAPHVHWSKALVSLKDMVMPSDNQIRYWRTHDIETTTLPGVGHYPFTLFDKWEDIIW